MTATPIYIVTPTFNSAETLERTLASVVLQAGDFEIFYHVQDGGSVDGTLDILDRWDDMISYGVMPALNRGVRFTYESRPDEGMYDAIARGFQILRPGADDWMGWINSDDVFTPGAFALLDQLSRQRGEGGAANVGWLTGTAAVAQHNVTQVVVDRKVARLPLAAGLCDGIHYDFLQAEGTFFRRSLWDSIDVNADFRAFRYAGDWNLWRLLAQSSQLHQCGYALGVFHRREGQLSDTGRDAYLQEIDRVVPREARRRALLDLAGREIPRTILKYDFATKLFAEKKENVEYQVRYWIGKVDPQALKASEGKKGASGGPAKGRTREPAPPPPRWAGKNFIVYDAQWQFPAITEEHAYRQAQRLLPDVENVEYLAFPWATLIDLINTKNERQHELRAELERLRPGVRPGKRIVTVCQHILMRQHIDLFEQAGVTDLFWAHATRDESELGEKRKIRIYPFPLYPVQVTSLLPNSGEEKRKHLFSFIGARANQWYLTKVRTWILDHLANDPRGLVVGRDEWHYNKVVYDHQVKKIAKENDALIDEEASAGFRNTLADSIFSLCPSGSGPNSIRLWESIGAGAIPVILADTWAPPGDRSLWEEAAVFCPETEEAVVALPDLLETMAKDSGLLQRKRSALHQLWKLYGPDSFIYDIQKLYLELSARPERCSEDNSSDKGTTRAASKAVSFFNAAPKRTSAPRVYLYGRHGHRTPLSYQPYQKLLGREIDLVATPEAADFLVVGFDLDLRENAAEIQALRRANPGLRLAVLSEEPLWDTLWSSGHRDRRHTITLEDTPVDLLVLNHFTTSIFDFEYIPYFLTTSDDFLARYASMFGRNCDVSAAALLDHWKAAQVRAAFYAEKRIGAKYDMDLQSEDIFCLCSFRSQTAEAAGPNRVIRAGQGWNEAPRRQTLPDWHLDKIAALDRRARVVSGLENTHLRHYITEKIFDAYAVMSMPLYYASPHHRIAEMVDPNSFINLYQMKAEDSARRALEFEPDKAFADAYRGVQHKLAELFFSSRAPIAERRRVIRGIAEALREAMKE